MCWHSRQVHFTNEPIDANKNDRKSSKSSECLCKCAPESERTNGNENEINQGYGTCVFHANASNS